MPDIILDGSYPIRNELLFDGDGAPYPSNGVGVMMMTALNKMQYADGIPPNDLSAYACTAVGGMKIGVNNGLALGGGVFHFLESSVEFEIEPAGAMAERKDLVVIQFTLADKGFARIVVLQGKFLADDLTRTSDVYQIGLCIVKVRPNATEILQSDITDVRLLPEFCGIMEGNLQLGDTDILWRQLDAALHEFIANSTAEYIRQVADWERQTAKQEVAWTEQTQTQQTDFEAMQAVWGAWIGSAIADPANYFQRNFDNPAMYIGSTRWKTKVDSKTTLEEIRGGQLETGPVAARRRTTTRTTGAEVEYTFFDLLNSSVISQFVEHFDRVSSQQVKNWMEGII